MIKMWMMVIPVECIVMMMLGVLQWQPKRDGMQPRQRYNAGMFLVTAAALSLIVMLIAAVNTAPMLFWSITNGLRGDLMMDPGFALAGFVLTVAWYVAAAASNGVVLFTIGRTAGRLRRVSFYQ